MTLDSSDWLAIQVRAKYENTVQSGLSNRGYEVFVPTYLDAGRTSRPLFTGYVFCRSSLHVSGKILTQPGVIRIVGIGRSPVYVPKHELEALRRLVDSDVKRRPWAYLPAGTQIRIENGPLRGIEGTLVSGANKRGLVLSVHMLQRSTHVELDHATTISVTRSVPAAIDQSSSRTGQRPMQRDAEQVT